MDLNSIVALAQAGFTKEQIYQLSQFQQTQQPVQPMQQPVQQPMQQTPQMMQQLPVQMPQMMQQPQMMPQPQMMQQPTPEEPPKQDPFMMLFEQMTGIKKAIQDNNIASSQITGGEPQTTDDILASIIQPTKPKEDK